jgi:hypothetical protein
MTTRFAVATGNWSSTSTWDNGALPLSDDVIYPNGFAVTLDQDITVGSLNNNTSNVYLPAMPIPLMTGNLTPSGEAFASQNTSTAYQAFDYNSATFWSSTNLTSCSIGYKFPIGKIIKRYYIFRNTRIDRPSSWTFEGSNDGTTYTVLETVTSNTASTPYLSGILANTTSYTYYRINITASFGGANTSVISLEMTENTGTTYGATNGGLFTVPNTLSGTRNITQTGSGIISNNITTVVSLNNTTGNTVNFNVSGVGLIINQLSQNSNNSFALINIAGNGAVNFNGDIYGVQAVITNTLGAIYINASATVTINGNIYLGKALPDGQGYFTVHLVNTNSNSAILNINGNVIGGNGNANAAINHNSTGTINVTGNLISNVSPCIVTGGVSTFGGGAGNINLVGTATLTNSTSQPCIISRGTLVTITGSITNKNSNMAIWAAKLRWVNTGTPYWVFQDTAGADITLTYVGAVGSYPMEYDVRLGVTYASSPVRTGTCVIPLPQYVSQGVPVDATVGTAYLDAAAMWNVPTSTIVVAGSIGERLKLASTVETTGNQISSYQI